MNFDLAGWLQARMGGRVDASSALPGRDASMFEIYPQHRLFERPIDEVPDGAEVAYFALGCYWGAEKLFWQMPGVLNTAVGFQGGFTPNPTYTETCTGRTGHAETVRVVFDPSRVSYDDLLRAFWESHDPTQGDRQGNDIGSQYRSAIFTTSAAQADAAVASKQRYEDAIAAEGFGAITTEIIEAPTFYYAETEHQQYLDKNPGGYQCHARTGVACPAAPAA